MRGVDTQTHKPRPFCLPHRTTSHSSTLLWPSPNYSSSRNNTRKKKVPHRSQRSAREEVFWGTRGLVLGSVNRHREMNELACLVLERRQIDIKDIYAIPHTDTGHGHHCWARKTLSTCLYNLSVLNLTQFSPRLYTFLGYHSDSLRSRNSLEVGETPMPAMSGVYYSWPQRAGERARKA